MLTFLSADDLSARYGRVDINDFAAQTALRLYKQSRNQSWWGQLWATLSQRSHRLLCLAQFQNEDNSYHQLYLGIKMVSIAQIQGSKSRCHDFDQDFNLLHDHNQSRWLGIATARVRGQPLPPVELIQVGDIYFVWDGHHRISVAQAMGQESIEAKVTLWPTAL